jgi:transposase
VEACKEKREKYAEEIKGIEKAKLVYIDESGVDMTMAQEKAWSQKGEAIIGKRSGKFYERMNIAAGYVNKKAIAPMVFTGSCNTIVFNAWVEQCLIKELQPGQVVVMDNASFHKSQKTIDLIESVGCKVVFLPPYSPDLNPIEKFWANMKRWIRRHILSCDHLFHAFSSFFNLPESQTLPEH